MPGKTLIFCVNDIHADLVVRLLKEAFDDHYGPVPDDTVKKITVLLTNLPSLSAATRMSNCPRSLSRLTC